MITTIQKLRLAFCYDKNSVVKRQQIRYCLLSSTFIRKCITYFPSIVNFASKHTDIAVCAKLPATIKYSATIFQIFVNNEHTSGFRWPLWFCFQLNILYFSVVHTWNILITIRVLNSTINDINNIHNVRKSYKNKYNAYI